MRVKLFLYVLVIAASISGCYYDDEQTLYQYVGTECNTSNVTFSTDILPVVASSCSKSGCHDSKTAAASIVLETYTQIKQSVDAGGFLGSIIHDTNYTAMPLSGQFLPQCDIDKIKVWIDNGALDN